MENAKPVPAAAGNAGPRAKYSWRAKWVWATVFSIVALALILWRSDLVVPFKVPSQSMQPAIVAGDRIFSENVTYKTRPPHRGDIIVFKNDFTDSLPDHCYCCKRVAGEPGEHLRITNGKLYINDQLMGLTNQAGLISYEMPTIYSGRKQMIDVVIPAGKYFVLGDNSTNSNDSRFFGFVPADRIMGRVSFCYWPLARVGKVE